MILHTHLETVTEYISMEVSSQLHSVTTTFKTLHGSVYGGKGITHMILISLQTIVYALPSYVQTHGGIK